MKTILTSLFLVVMTISFGQTQQTPTLFAQCMFDIQDQQEMQTLETELKMHPYTNIVRLDWHTQRAFVLTMGLNDLTEEDFRSWFGDYGESLTCIQIGVHGIDVVNPYPFENCEE